MIAFKLQSCTPDTCTCSVPSFTRLTHIIYINNVVNKVFIQENRDFVNRIYFSFNLGVYIFFQKTLTSQILNFLCCTPDMVVPFFQNITVLKQLHEQATYLHEQSTYLTKIKAKTSKLSNK